MSPWSMAGLASSTSFRRDGPRAVRASTCSWSAAGAANWRCSSCFTLAHTLTLGAAALGVVDLGDALGEPLSRPHRLRRHRSTVRWRHPIPLRCRFAFGLLHGLGFASVLRNRPAGRVVPAVAAQPGGGVELVQLAVLAAAFVLLGASGRALLPLDRLNPAQRSLPAWGPTG